MKTICMSRLRQLLFKACLVTGYKWHFSVLRLRSNVVLPSSEVTGVGGGIEGTIIVSMGNSKEREAICVRRTRLSFKETYTGWRNWLAGATLRSIMANAKYCA